MNHSIHLIKIKNMLILFFLQNKLYNMSNYLSKFKYLHMNHKLIHLKLNKDSD